MAFPAAEIRILRIYGQSSNISADIFENAFRKNIGALYRTEYMSALEFATLLHEKQYGVLDSYSYICPDYHIMPVVPWLMQLRNRNHLGFAIIFISHSPGLYGLEWYLMRNLICRKDIIVAPSSFSGSVIALLAPALRHNIEIISHPLDLHKNHCHPHKRGDRIVTLSRIVEDKLIHRQIDAMALLVHKYGYGHLEMHIGGSLADSETGEHTSYARLLLWKIRLLNLEQHVFLTGEIKSRDKNEFFRDSFVSINLSRTLEEAFPKASVEALSFGIPVVSTLWNGFRETVGNAGVLLELLIDKYGRADVDVNELAEAIIRLYENPTPEEICLDQIKQYNSSNIKENYLRVVSIRAAEGTEPVSNSEENPGLLDTISFLKMFTHSELMENHSEWAAEYFKSIRENRKKHAPSSETFFRVFIPDALKEILTLFYSFKCGSDVTDSFSLLAPDDATACPNDFREKMHRSIYASGNAHSKRTLLRIFSERPDLELLKEAIMYFSKTGDVPSGDYFIPYLDYLDGKYSDVCSFYSKQYGSRFPDINQDKQLCLWAKAAIKCSRTEEVSGCMSNWLERYKTEPEALTVHLEYLVLLINANDTHEEAIQTQFEIIREICFDKDVAHKFEALTHAR